MDLSLRSEIITALEWYVDQGVTETLLDEVVDRTAVAQEEKITSVKSSPAFLGKHDAYSEAVKLANRANNLEELQKIIIEFDGISLKKTATNMVFSDGNINADIMLIGDAPIGDDDRAGKAFSGIQGQFLDRVLKSIDLDRKSVYLSNILNWRPPGNRTPSSAEIEVSLPFIERHIQLVKPEILILCGSVAAKSLLGRSESISRLRKSWHDYTPITSSNEAKAIPAIVTYSMDALIKTPLQKKSAWADMLMLQEKL